MSAKQAVNHVVKSVKDKKKVSKNTPLETAIDKISKVHDYIEKAFADQKKKNLLSERELEAMTLRYNLDGCGFRTMGIIAMSMKIRYGTVATVLRSARRKLGISHGSIKI